ncbi:MAG: UDP-N-acetylglucosamine--N-acetylmuramyl-(pentapeptide) pyrophosphoryl-undecaprenol N-acetylglucosamine transferase [Candidatus Gracilibacteria bacterium]
MHELRILLSGGGTAGHVLPHIAVLKALKKIGEEKLTRKTREMTAAEKVAEVLLECAKKAKILHSPSVDQGKLFLYIGSKAGPEKALAEQWGIPYQAIATGKWRRYLDFENILLNVRDLVRIKIGVFQAIFAVRRFKPDVIFSKGGYVSVPVLIAGWLLRVPIVIHDSDAIPGMTTRIVARFATRICLGYKEAADYFKSEKIKAKIVVTGVPIREEILKGTRAQGLKKSGLKGAKPIVLIMGGSLGAEKINRAVREALPELLKKVEILHITGKGKMDSLIKPENDKSSRLNKSRNEVGDRENTAKGAGKSGYCQIEYANEDLADFYAMSDLIVSRAGANSIAEIEALHKPCILIPLGGKVSHGDQAANAAIMKKQGQCRVIADEELSGEKLLGAARSFCGKARKN